MKNFLALAAAAVAITACGTETVDAATFRTVCGYETPAVGDKITHIEEGTLFVASAPFRHGKRIMVPAQHTAGSLAITIYVCEDMQP